MDIKIKRHYKAVLLFIFVIFFFGFVIGDTMITPYSSENKIKVNTALTNIENEIYIFDDSKIHEIEVKMTQEDYDSMFSTFKETKTKDYFPADITIDGVTIKNVGIRLKGNSSLNNIFGGNSKGMNNEGNYTKNIQAPYLIKLDKYVDGQSYQGITEIAVRTGSFRGSVSLLEESLSLYVFREVGQIVPEYSYASVKLMDNEPLYYVICENIDGNYVEKYFGDTDGNLYKKGNSTDFSYKGEDQTKYVDEYELKTNKKEEDYSSLIEFLKFISESSDQEFEEELPNWLDLDSFVTMLALNDLLDNQDSFSGQGRNFYLYYNPETKQFTMLAWDFNLAFGGFGGGGNRDSNNSFQGPGDMQAPGRDFNRSFQPREGMQTPNMDANGTFQRPEAMQTPNGDFNRSFEGRDGAGDIQMMDQRGGTNMLKERFFANEKFNLMYEERYEELSKIIYCDDLLLEKIEYISNIFEEYNKEHKILDQETYDSDVREKIDFINNKKKSFCQES